MKLKQIPEDFIVNEIYDLENFKERDEGRSKPYFYFKLIKKNFAQMRALEIIANTLNTSKKLVHFAGTKDKVGITSQLISVYGVNESILEENIKHLHKTFPDLKLELIGEFKGRVNLGDNKGNEFNIIVRDFDLLDIDKAKLKVDELNKDGVLNYFDEQRFGYANNSHIVGKLIMKNQVKEAVKMIMTSMPNNSSSELLKEFTDYINENFEEIALKNEEIIDKALELCPRYLQNENKMLEHLKIHQNDFPGAFRKIHKKLRMLYINAYQSYIFNEVLKELYLNNKEILEELSLPAKDIEFKEDIKPIVDRLLKEDELTQEMFTMPHMPELKIFSALRKTRIFPENIEISEVEDDDLNEGKLKAVVSFNLGSGEYATNVAKQLFD